MSAPADFLAIVADVARARDAAQAAEALVTAALDARSAANERLRDAEKQLNASIDSMIAGNRVPRAARD